MKSHREMGVLVRLWRWLFAGGGCSSSLCYGLADPRCWGGNCTRHCKQYDHCNGSCLDRAELLELAAILRLKEHSLTLEAGRKLVCSVCGSSFSLGDLRGTDGMWRPDGLAADPSCDEVVVSRVMTS